MLKRFVDFEKRLCSHVGACRDIQTKVTFFNNVLFEMFFSKLLQIKKLYTWSKNNNQNQFLVLLGIS